MGSERKAIKERLHPSFNVGLEQTNQIAPVQRFLLPGLALPFASSSEGSSTGRFSSKIGTRGCRNSTDRSGSTTVRCKSISGTRYMQLAWDRDRPVSASHVALVTGRFGGDMRHPPQYLAFEACHFGATVSRKSRILVDGMPSVHRKCGRTRSPTFFRISEVQRNDRYVIVGASISCTAVTVYRNPTCLLPSHLRVFSRRYSVRSLIPRC